MAEFTITVKNMREATVTNHETGVTKQCKVEPYARDGKPNGYVVMDDALNAPQKRYNIKDFTGPVHLERIKLTGKNKSTYDWTAWGENAELRANQTVDESAEFTAASLDAAFEQLEAHEAKQKKNKRK